MRASKATIFRDYDAASAEARGLRGRRIAREGEFLDVVPLTGAITGGPAPPC